MIRKRKGVQYRTDKDKTPIHLADDIDIGVVISNARVPAGEVRYAHGYAAQRARLLPCVNLTCHLRLRCPLLDNRWAKLPDDAFYPDLIKSVENNGHKAIMATAPCSDGDIALHVGNLEKLVEEHGGLGPDCVFVGHSIGTQIIMRYLMSRSEDTVVAGAALFAAWVDLSADILSKLKCDPWVVPFKDDEKAKLQKCCPKLKIFISSDDNIVGLGAQHETGLKTALPWADVMVASDRGHYVVPSLNDAELAVVSDLTSA